MRDDRDYKLDLSGTNRQASATRPDSRPFVGVQFACCNVYSRVYRNLDGSKYEGRCPRCARSITFVVGERGTDQRFFVVK